MVVLSSSKKEVVYVSSSPQLSGILKSFNAAALRAEDGSLVASYGRLVDGAEYTIQPFPDQQLPAVASVTLRFDACCTSAEDGGEPAVGPLSITFKSLTDVDLQRALSQHRAAGVVLLGHGEDPLDVCNQQNMEVLTSVLQLEKGKEYFLVPAADIRSLASKVRLRASVCG